MGYDDVKLGVIDRIKVFFGQSEENLLLQKKINIATKDAKAQYKEGNIQGQEEAEYVERYLMEQGLIVRSLPNVDSHDDFVEKYKVNEEDMLTNDNPEVTENLMRNPEDRLTGSFQNLLAIQKETVAEMEQEYQDKYVKGSTSTRMDIIRQDPEMQEVFGYLIGNNEAITYEDLERVKISFEKQYEMYKYDGLNIGYYHPDGPNYQHLDEEGKKKVDEALAEYEKGLSVREKTLAHIEGLLTPKREYEGMLAGEKNRTYQLERYTELVPYTGVTNNEDFEEYRSNRSYPNNDEAISIDMEELKKDPEMHEVLKRFIGDGTNLKVKDIRTTLDYLNNSYRLQQSDPYYMNSGMTNNEYYGPPANNQFIRENEMAAFGRSIEYLEGTVGPEINSGEWLSQEEKAIYTYLHEKRSPEKAAEYLGKMTDIINKRKGLNQSNDYIDKIIKSNEGVGDFINDMWVTSSTGFGDGVVTFGEGMANVFTHDGIMSENQYKQMYINTVLTREYNVEEVQKLSELLQSGSEQEKVTAREALTTHGLLKEDGTIDNEAYTRYGEVAKLGDLYRQGLGVNYDTAVSVGNAFVPVATGAAVNAVTLGTGGQAVTLGLMGASSTGNAIEEAHQNGITGAKGYLYGITTGLSEVATEKLLGGIPGLSNADELVSKPLKTFVKSNLTEGMEEFVQNYVSYGTKAVFEMPANFENMNEDALKSFYQGALTGSVMNGGSIAVQAAGKTINLTTAELSNLSKEGKFNDQKFVDALIGKEVPQVDYYTPIDQKLNEAIGLMTEYHQKELSQYISTTDFDNTFNKLQVHNDFAELQQAFQSAGGSNVFDAVSGFFSYKDDKIHISPERDTHTIIHEYLHALPRPTLARGGTQINEAFTEYYANQISKRYTPIAYTGNANAVEKIDSTLKSLGYTETSKQAYFSAKWGNFEKTINSLTYSGFYSKLSKQMDIAVEGKTDEARSTAQLEVDRLSTEFHTLTIGKHQQSMEKVISEMNAKNGQGSGIKTLTDYANGTLKDRKINSSLKQVPANYLQEYIKDYSEIENIITVLEQGYGSRETALNVLRNCRFCGNFSSIATDPKTIEALKAIPEDMIQSFKSTQDKTNALTRENYSAENYQGIVR